MKKKKLILIIILAIMALVLGIFLIVSSSSNKLTDAKKFSSEYTQVDENNIFVYKSIDEIINILENGTGIVYLGFPECPWCQRYSVYLNEVAKDMGFDKINYYNIKNDRSENTEEYQKIISLIGEFLQYDDDGNKRIYVPCVIAVYKGEIVGFNDETAWDTKGYDTPEEYWTDEEVEQLKDDLTEALSKANENICTSCNEE